MIEFNSKNYKRGSVDICACACHDPKEITHMLHEPGVRCCEQCPVCKINIVVNRLAEHKKEHGEQNAS